MVASALLVVAAPLALVLVALLLAALREHAGPSEPRLKCAWRFLRAAARSGRAVTSGGPPAGRS